MLINLFDVDGDKLVPGAACFAIPWLKCIKDEYFKEDYIQVYKYLFWTTCPDGTINPYVNLPEDEREAVVMSDLGELKFSLEDPVILEAIAGCKRMYETPILRTFKGAKVMLDKIGKFLAEEEISTGKEGNDTAVDRYMTKLTTYWENYSKLEGILKEEQAKVRGEKCIPYWQQDGFRSQKEY